MHINNKGREVCRKKRKGLRTLNHQMSSSDLNTLKQRLREFAEARDWDHFHSPKNLSMALSNDGVWFNTKVLIAVGEKL